MLIKHLKYSFGLLVFTVLFLTGVSFVKAQDVHSYRGEIITPYENVLNGQTGSIIKGTILFSNDQPEGDINVYINVHDFKPDVNGNGIDENVSYDSKSSLASWVSLSDNQLTVKKGETATVSYTIKVPLDAEFGGKYATISFDRILPSSDLSSINLKTRLHHLIFFNVDGNLKEDLKINKLTTDKNIYFDTNPNVTFKTEILNVGNIHLIPTGYIEIKGLFNNEKVEFNSQSGSKQGFIIPDPNIVREYISSWNGGNLKFGSYTATLHLKYGEGANLTEKLTSVSFFILPWTVPALIIILVMIYLIHYKFKKIGAKKIKSKKRRL